MNRHLFSKFFSEFSLKSYGIYTFVICVIVLAICALVNYVEIHSMQDILILLVWPFYGTWLFLRYFALEMIVNETVIPSWIGYLCFLFFIGWGIAIFGFRKKRARRLLIVVLLLFALAFIGGCTYMTAELSPYGLI